MAEIQIAWLELMTVGGLGVILVLLGVTFNIIVKDRIIVYKKDRRYC